ncbi:CaiB/BaiF CoA-transferase family protein [soil metagenome]
MNLPAPGPLSGLRIVEFAGLGPAPYATMLLADLGADVIRIERVREVTFVDPAIDLLNRGKRSIALDLKRESDLEVVMQLLDRSDGLVEGFRPGVMERLGLGPDPVLTRRPSLVYGRMTGWGQTGPLAPRAGHDLNYLAVTGALHAIGARDAAPAIPLNLVADFGGGGMLMAFGMMSALWRVAQGGAGQVVDAAMVDGAASLMTMTYSFLAAGSWQDQRGSNLLDGGAAHYGTYACSDGAWLAVAPLEPAFLTRFLHVVGIDAGEFGAADDPTRWPRQRGLLEAALATASRDEWIARFEGIDACVAPVLSMNEAPQFAHNRARDTFVAIDDRPGRYQPGPVPRFSATPAARPGRPPMPGEHTDAVLAELGIRRT